MQKKSQSGQTLLEVLVALSVILLIVSAVTIAVISSLSNAQFSKNQSLANQYAQEGIEVVRRMRDSNLTLFKSYPSGSSFCLDQNQLSLDPSKDLRNATIPGCQKTGATGNNGINVSQLFAREIDFNPGGSSSPCTETKVSVIVSWSDTKCVQPNLFCHNVTLDSCFSVSAGTVPTP